MGNPSKWMYPWNAPFLFSSSKKSVPQDFVRICWASRTVLLRKAWPESFAVPAFQVDDFFRVGGPRGWKVWEPKNGGRLFQMSNAKRALACFRVCRGYILPGSRFAANVNIINTPYSKLKTFNISNLRLLYLLVSNHQTIINDLDLVVKTYSTDTVKR